MLAGGLYVLAAVSLAAAPAEESGEAAPSAEAAPVAETPPPSGISTPDLAPAGGERDIPAELEEAAEELLELAAEGTEDEEIEKEAAAEAPSLAFTIGGYWKTRGVFIHELFLGQANFTNVGRVVPEGSEGRVRALSQTGYFEHGLRLSPAATYKKDLISFRADLDILEGVVWGDNAAKSATALFASQPSDIDRFGDEVDAVGVRRLWLELKLPVGLLKVGRQPSHWGLGLLSNKGDGLDADFGDFYRGSTFDRILFATRPLSIAKAIMKAEGKSWLDNFLLAVAYDQLVDDDLTVDDIDSERACTTCAPQILLARPGDDVQEWVGVLMYKDEDAELLSADDLIQAGVYVVYRSQSTTDSALWIIDGHAKLRLGPAGLETEIIVATGESSALPPEDSRKDVALKAGVVRGGFYIDWLDIELELGYAPGDDDALDDNFTSYPFHSDYNVGLLLYDEVLAARTAASWGEDARGLWTKGGVYNSIYVMPKVRWRPVPGLTAILAVLWARANENDGPLWAESREPEGSELDLGWEVDLAVRYDFWDYAHVKLESGVLFPGKALWDLNGLRNDEPADVAFTVQGRMGFVF